MSDTDKEDTAKANLNAMQKTLHILHLLAKANNLLIDEAIHQSEGLIAAPSTKRIEGQADQPPISEPEPQPTRPLSSLPPLSIFNTGPYRPPRGSKYDHLHQTTEELLKAENDAEENS